MKQKNNYQVIVGNVGTMDYTSKKLAVDCFKTYRTMSMQGVTRAANEPVTLMKNGEIIDEHNPQFQVGQSVICNGDIDIIVEFLTNDPDGYEVILKEHGTQTLGCISRID